MSSANQLRIGLFLRIAGQLDRLLVAGDRVVVLLEPELSVAQFIPQEFAIRLQARPLGAGGVKPGADLWSSVAELWATPN